MTERATLNAQIPNDLADRLERAAKGKQISRDEIVRAALAQWLQRDDDQHRMTLEAIESADRGELISQDDVDEWVAKLCRGAADRR